MTRSRRTALAALSAAVVALMMAGCFSAPRDIEVTIDAGTLRGVNDDGVRSWLGIPYAAPPEGALRWRPPRPVGPWSEERDAVEFAEPCLQADGIPEQGSEDCLYLNVFRPDTDDQDLPVMVWIHGGGLNSGDGDLPIDTVTGLVEKGVVLVSFNYRLGRLGYFAHPALEKENSQPVANFGLLDQIAALRWVQNNIGEFGGDREDVTIFGISAGGASVNYLMSAPSARGLFDKAIAGSPLGRERPDSWNEATARGESLAATLEEADADADTLRAIDGAAIAALPGHILRNDVPILDSVLLESVEDTFGEGKEAKVPYIVGTTDLELIDAHFGLIGVDAPSLREQLVAGHEDDASDVYKDADDYTQHFLNDLIFAEPARYLAEMHAKRAPTYLYRFSIAGDDAREEYGGALHGADLPYVFGDGSVDRTVDNSRELADEISTCWESFATTGEPSCGDTGWPTARKGEFIDFTNDGPVVVADDPWKSRLDLAELISTTFPDA